MKDAEAGDVCLINLKVNVIFKFILGCVYIHPGTALAEIKLFFLRSLLNYSKNIAKIIPDYDRDLTTPNMIVGDFNGKTSQYHSVPGFRLSELNLSYNESSPTTLGNTCNDLTRLSEISMYPVLHVCHTFRITDL
ncbi:gamma-aminobutyric acid type B receptor subunit 1 [Trichonephila clavata]|uniref:Gamma-aminobutyric acid type B receptor subunit 1 n=1 Tax=Trichonephila clavata TaxID=2740835 RepID=A0A8X6H2N2_TRICU|nr:gamma-aminobutyric acid type B receptor subunit 1 [Trichonephila clavata]